MSQTDKKSTPLVVHAKFDPADADLILTSTESVRARTLPLLEWLADACHPTRSRVQFKVHKRDMQFSSTVFADMLDTGTTTSGKVDDVPLSEHSSVLEIVLPYCQPGRVPPPPNASSGLFWEVARCFYKYEIGSGIDVIVAWAQ